MSILVYQREGHLSTKEDSLALLLNLGIFLLFTRNLYFSSSFIISITMAPDISQMSAYYESPSKDADSYQIPDITFCDPKNRRLKVLTIGAGVSGIMMAYQIQKQCEKYDFLYLAPKTLFCEALAIQPL